MAKITDPDLLMQGSEVIITPLTKKIALVKTGDLTDDGITLQCLYSFLKEEWKDDPSLIKYDFPMISITNEMFELINGFLEGAITSDAAATALKVPIRVCYNNGDADSFITTTGVNSTSKDHIIHGTCYIACQDTGVFQPCWGSGVSDSGATLMAGSMLSYQEAS